MTPSSTSHAEPLGVARDLARYIDASPSPFHACESAARELEAAGFRRLAEPSVWDAAAGSFFVQRGGSLVAWHLPVGLEAWSPFRIIGAHTDSPNLRVKPRPDVSKAGVRQLGVEVYGGVLLHTWLDRDLGLSGRLFLRRDGRPEERLFRIDRPVLRIPNLAIHLQRDINEQGLALNRQQHMVPVIGSLQGTVPGFRDFLATELGLEADAILSWDAMCHDVQPAALVGAKEEFLSAARLDNLFSSWTGLKALLSAVASEPTTSIPVLSLFDHEEVGSASSRGAAGPILRDLLERTVLARGGSREDWHRALATSVCVSVDMAHATHPNYSEKHDPEHTLLMNAGPVIKINANQRYATEGETEALFQAACERSGVPVQKWVNRTDLACGSTIGPLTASQLGIRTVDVGCAQLAMHSIREMCGSADPAYMIRALTAWLSEEF